MNPTLPPYMGLPALPRVERKVQLMLPVLVNQSASPDVPGWQDGNALLSSSLATEVRAGALFCNDIINSMPHQDIDFLCMQFDLDGDLGKSLKIAEVSHRGAAFSVDWMPASPHVSWIEVSLNHTHVLRTLRAIAARGMRRNTHATYTAVMELIDALWGGSVPSLSSRVRVTGDTLRYFLSTAWADGKRSFTDEDNVQYWFHIAEGIRQWVIAQNFSNEYS